MLKKILITSCFFCAVSPVLAESIFDNIDKYNSISYTSPVATEANYDNGNIDRQKIIAKDKVKEESKDDTLMSGLGTAVVTGALIQSSGITNSTKTKTTTATSGARQYFVNGKEMSEAEYNAYKSPKAVDSSGNKAYQQLKRTAAETNSAANSLN